MKKQNGFSLIELMIVIGLIGILSAVTIFSYRGYRDNTNLKTAAKDIATDIATTRQRAVSETLRYRITFSTSSNNYVIEQGSDASGTTYSTLQTKTPTVLGTGSGLAIANPNFSGTAQIVFFTRGTLSTGSVQLTNSRNSTATITVNATGRTYVQFTMQ